MRTDERVHGHTDAGLWQALARAGGEEPHPDAGEFHAVGLYRVTGPFRT